MYKLSYFFRRLFIDLISNELCSGGKRFGDTHKLRLCTFQKDLSLQQLGVIVLIIQVS